MVRNREELLRVASQHAGQLKNEVSRGLKGFMSAKRVSASQLAHVLGINEGHMNEIVRGTAQLNVDDLSKILVALDLAVEIKPVSMTPVGGYGDGFPLGKMPRGGKKAPMPFGGPMPPMPFGGPMPFPHEPFAEPAEPQPRDERGRFVRRNATANRPSAEPNGGEFEMLSDDELKDIILRNLWDGEIDVNRASHGALAAFVNRKDMLMKNRQDMLRKQRSNGDMPAPEEVVGSEPRAFEHECDKPCGGLKSEEKPAIVNSFLEALGNIAKAVENDPRLAETFERFMPKR